MKVIRLVEDEVNNQEIKQQSANMNKTVDLNKVVDAFTKGGIHDENGNFKKIKPDEAVTILKALYPDVIPQYGSNDTTNFKEVLDNYKVPFIEYFIQCLDPTNLGDRNDPILTALSNNNAPNLLNGDQLRFTTLFNLANTSRLKLNSEYFNRNDAIVYYPDLYRKVRDQKTLEGIVRFDNANPDRAAELKSAIDNSDFSIIKSSIDDEESVSDRAVEDFNKLSDEGKKLFLQKAGIKDTIADFILNALKENEANNSK